jgi:serine O-acetyltransferase
MLHHLKADIARYRAEEGNWRSILANLTFFALFWYRLGHWMYRENCPRLIRVPLKLVYVPVYFWIQNFLQISLPPSAQIGPGAYLSHVGGIHLSPQAVIGSNCDIAHHVTIGVSAMGRKGVPQIGNHVYIGTGAVLIGRIKVGDGARIAANSVVMSNVPAGSTVMGAPARVIMTAQPPAEGSNAAGAL